ncbi:MAG: membrane integrity-associated transporter subunit PqiC [Opitutales bacterium]|nr:membrane integrity-associated transporter subunit PqiC [Opitutales bacterium]
MKKIIRNLAPIAALSLLCSCIGISIDRPHDTTKYYTLPPAQASAKIGGLENAKICVFQVRVPAYMARPQIVAAGQNPSEILIDDSNLWAEPIEDALTRAAIAGISAISGSQNVQQPLIAGLEKDAAAVKIDILKCIGSLGGKLEFKAQYSISNADSSKSFIFETSENAGEDFSAYAAAIAKAAEALCQDICKNLSSNK